MRRTFSEHGRAYWSAEFGLILEKHGWLDYELAEPEVLASQRDLAGHALVIVAWLPEDHWRPEYVQSLRGFDGIVLLEGPFPPAVEELLGIERSGEATVGARGALSFAESARAYIDRRFGESFPIGHRSGPDPSLIVAAGGDPRPLELAPRESVTRRSGIDRSAYFEIDPVPLAENVGKAALSIALTYRARFQRTERFFEDPVEDALALLACVRTLAALRTEPMADAFGRLVRDAAGSSRPPVALSDERSALARVVWAVALLNASVTLDDPTFAERAKEVVADVRGEWLARKRPDPVLTRWRALLALELSELAAAHSAGAAPGLLQALLPTEPEDGGRRAAIGRWLDLSILARLGGEAPESLQPSRVWIQGVASALKASSGPTLPRQLDGSTLPDLMLTLGALTRSGQVPAARRLWRTLVETLYDLRQGLFLGGKVVKGKLVPTLTFTVTPVVALGLLDAADPIQLSGGPTEALESYSAEQLGAWAAPPYALQPYDGVDEEQLVATLEVEGNRLPAIWRVGNVFATSFQLLSQIVHIHTVEPLAEPFATFRSGDTLALEYLLLALLGSSLAGRKPRSVHVATWPWGVRYGLTVRHDVDRVLDEHQFSRLFDFERRHGLGVSWFWLPDRLELDQIATLEREPRHEVALHAVRIERKRDELQIVGEPLAKPIVGEAIHGSGDSWLGHLSVRAAVDAGLLYTELAPPVADTPYARYPWVDSDGVIRSERIIGISYNISIEGKLGTKPGSEGGPRLYRQLLNHPDLNFDRVEGWINALPREPRVDWTCEQLARWWQATHVSGSLSIAHVAGEEPDAMIFEVAAQASVEDLELRIPCAPGAVSGVSVDAQDAEWAVLDEPEYPGIRVRISLQAGIGRIVSVRCLGFEQVAESVVSRRIVGVEPR